MKVTIDTKEDSHEDINKIFQILVSILEKKGLNEHHSTSETVDTTNIMNMFSTEQPQKEIPDTPPDFSSLIKLTREGSRKSTNSNTDPKIEIF